MPNYTSFGLKATYNEAMSKSLDNLRIYVGLLHLRELASIRGFDFLPIRIHS